MRLAGRRSSQDVTAKWHGRYGRRRQLFGRTGLVELAQWARPLAGLKSFDRSDIRSTFGRAGQWHVDDAH
jgi:hypothetical protein